MAVFKKISNPIFLYYYKIMYGERFKVEKSIKFGRKFLINFDLTKSSIYLGKNVQFRDYCQIRSENNGILTIGDNVFFNNFCSINCLSKIEIGSNCQFGESVKIYDVNHKHLGFSKLFSEQGYNSGHIIIGNNCWISSNVTILKDVIIGNNVVIGANCLLHKSVPSNTIVTGESHLVFKPLL